MASAAISSHLPALAEPHVFRPVHEQLDELVAASRDLTD
jgi:hypothetical protein